MKLLRLGLIAAVSVGLAACATRMSKPSKTVWSSLDTFSSDRAFEHYYLTVTDQLEPEAERGLSGFPVPPPPPPPPPPPSVSAPAPVASAPAQEIVVTGSKVGDANPSITNTQEAGVDEGDIVKQIGQHLVLMQDGRLFSIDLEPGGEAGLSFVDRENVYRSAEEDTWYDEMLVFGRDIIAIGYSYDQSASVFAILHLDEDGDLEFRDRFFLPAQDYYDGDNYSTRLVNGQLALHTSFYLEDAGSFADLNAPVLTRKVRGDTPEKLNAKAVYRPLQDTDEPLLHTVTICPLKDIGMAGKPVPDCRTTAFVAGDEYEYYASTDAVWLWLNETRNHWDEPEKGDGAATSALLYQIPYAAKSAPSVARVQGEPVNQFSLAAAPDVFRALVMTEDGEGEEDMRLLELPRGAFSRKLNQRKGIYHDVPEPEHTIENRFTGTHLVYALKNAGPRYWRWDWNESDGVGSTLAVVPLDAPSRIARIDLPHSVIRLERARDHIVATGYNDFAGLNLSLVDLRGDAPRFASNVKLASRFESENRSHAFNSAIGAEGDGLIGIPTELRISESGREVWRSKSSDLSFLQVDTDGALRSIGALTSGDGKTDPSYECEVSCIDWYGNSRPIFTMGRIFGLSGTEIIEGELANGRIAKIRSLDVTGKPGTKASETR